MLIFFDGSDSDNLTEKVLNSILATNYQGRINIILGLDYPNKEEFVSKIESNPAIQVYTNVSDISEFILKQTLFLLPLEKQHMISVHWVFQQFA